MKPVSFVLALALLLAGGVSQAATFNKNTGAAFTSATATRATAGFVPSAGAGAAATFSQAGGKAVATLPVQMGASNWNNFMASARAMAEPKELARTLATGRGLGGAVGVGLLGTMFMSGLEGLCVKFLEAEWKPGSGNTWAECKSGEGPPTTMWSVQWGNYDTNTAFALIGAHPTKSAAASAWKSYMENGGGLCPGGVKPSYAIVQEEPYIILRQYACPGYSGYSDTNGGYISRVQPGEPTKTWVPVDQSRAEQLLEQGFATSCADGNPICGTAFEKMIAVGADVEVGDPVLNPPTPRYTPWQETTTRSTMPNPADPSEQLTIIDTSRLRHEQKCEGKECTRTEQRDRTRTILKPDGTVVSQETTSSTTETSGPDKEKDPSEEAKWENSDLPEVPDLYERKYPDGLAGVWEVQSAKLLSGPIFQFLDGLVPQVGNGGCPTWQWPSAQVLGITVGGDISVPCYVWSFVRLVMVISALLLARRLIFGG